MFKSLIKSVDVFYGCRECLQEHVSKINSRRKLETALVAKEGEKVCQKLLRILLADRIYVSIFQVSFLFNRLYFVKTKILSF